MNYILIIKFAQEPLEIKLYSSLVALIEDNDLKVIGASKSKLEKYPFDDRNYSAYGITIAKRKAYTSGDIRKIKASKAV